MHGFAMVPGDRRVSSDLPKVQHIILILFDQSSQLLFSVVP